MASVHSAPAPSNAGLRLAPGTSPVDLRVATWEPVTADGDDEAYALGRTLAAEALPFSASLGYAAVEGYTDQIRDNIAAWEEDATLHRERCSDEDSRPPTATEERYDAAWLAARDGDVRTPPIFASRHETAAHWNGVRDALAAREAALRPVDQTAASFRREVLAVVAELAGRGSQADLAVARMAMMLADDADAFGLASFDEWDGMNCELTRGDCC